MGAHVLPKKLYTEQNEKSTANFRKFRKIMTVFFHSVNFFTIMVRKLHQKRCTGEPVHRFFHNQHFRPAQRKPHILSVFLRGKHRLIDGLRIHAVGDRACGDPASGNVLAHDLVKIGGAHLLHHSIGK